MQPTSLKRRDFLRAASTAVAAFSLVPRHVIAASGQTPPSERLNIASIGISGMGGADVGEISRDKGVNYVALCDVDSKHAAKTFEKFPGVKQYKDFRRMFDEMEKNIDAVSVSTPDHCHAVAAMAAIKRRKHVYCQKPLAHSVFEVRQLMKAAREYNVVTQLGNQGHSFGTIRDFCEMIRAGTIGNVRTIHAGATAKNSALGALASLSETHAVPATLDWDLWLGPAAFRPYHPAYLPGSWRAWTPFGNGTVGDWMCHVVDPVFWAFDLGAPTSVVASVKNYDPKTQGDSFPKGEIITYQFAAKGQRGPITLHWYSGSEKIPTPPELAEDEKDEKEKKGVGTGAAVLGDKGTIIYGSHGAGQVRLVPQARRDAFKRPAQTIPRAKEHHADWLDAIRTGRKAGSDFSYGGALTELAMLGVIAIKFPGARLEWDAPQMRFTNHAEANQHLNPPYRKGWTL